MTNSQLPSFMTAIVNGLELILLSRILTGMSESPAFPGSFKATGYWFLVRERGRATTSITLKGERLEVLGAL